MNYMTVGTRCQCWKSVPTITTVTTTPSNGEHRQVSEHLDPCAFTFHCWKISHDQTSVVIGTARKYEFGLRPLQTDCRQAIVVVTPN